MTGMDYAAIIILVLTAVIVVGLLYFLASWPGRIAAERGHPHVEAVRIGGYATLVFGGIFWPLVLMWAYTAHPLDPPAVDPPATGEPEAEA